MGECQALECFVVTGGGESQCRLRLRAVSYRKRVFTELDRRAVQAGVLKRTVGVKIGSSRTSTPPPRARSGQALATAVAASRSSVEMSVYADGRSAAVPQSPSRTAA